MAASITSNMKRLTSVVVAGYALFAGAVAAPAQAVVQAPTISFPVVGLTSGCSAPLFAHLVSHRGRGGCTPYTWLTGATISPSDWASKWSITRCTTAATDGASTWSTGMYVVGADGVSLEPQFSGLSSLNTATIRCAFAQRMRAGLSWGYKAVTPYKTRFHVTNANDYGIHARCTIRYTVLGGTKSETWTPSAGPGATVRTSQWYIHVRGMSCSYVYTANVGAEGQYVPPPPTPANLVASAENGTVAVDLSWDCSPGATDYTVERIPDGGTWTPIGTTGGACSFQDASTDLQPGTHYRYGIAAQNSSGSSGLAAADVITWAPPPPTG